MAKADLNINVKVEGAEKAEKQLEGVGKSARKAGDGAKKGGAEFKSLGKGIGDVSENLDKRLEQSVGRSFKGFDRLTSVVGQATGALALMTGAVALLKAGYDKLIAGPKKLREEQQRLAIETQRTVEALQNEAKELGSLQERVQFTALAHRKALPALEGFEKSLRRQVEILREQKVAADAARVASDAFLRSIVDDKFAVALEQRTAVLEARRQEAVAIKGLEAAELNFTKVQSENAQVRVVNARRELQFRRDVLAEEIFLAKQQAGKIPAPTPLARPRPVDEEAGFGDGEGGDLEFLLAQERVARQEIEQAQAAAELRRQERARIDRANELALIQDDDTRQLLILADRHAAEFALAEKAGADLFALRRRQQGEIDSLEEAAAARRRQRQQENVQRTITSASAVAAALGAGAKAFGLGVGVEMFAQGLQDVGTAASEGSKAAARFAVFDVVGGAAHTLAAGLATAAAVKNFAGASQLGKGGGSAGGAPAAIPAPPPRRGDIGEGEGGERVTNINVTFTGRSFVTQREIREDVAGILGSRGRGGRAVTA